MTPARARNVTLSLSPIWIWLAAFLFVAVLVTAAVGGVTYFNAMRRLADYTDLVAEVEALRLQNVVVQELELELRELRGLQQQMLQLAGIKPALGVDPRLASELPGSSLEGELPPSRRSELLFWPVEGTVLRDFGPSHPGVDIAAPRKRTVMSAGEGVVTAEKRTRKLGNRVAIQHSDTLATVYANMELSLVAVGDTVQAGQVIGLVGKGFEGKEPHLHFEVLVRDKAVLPKDRIPELFPD